MRTFRFSEVLAKLEELDPWLAHLGIDPKSNDRIHKAIGALQTAEEGWKAFRETHEVTKIGNIGDYHFGITEALEFSDIYVAFRNEAPEVLGPKLQRALKGPFRPTVMPTGTDEKGFLAIEKTLPQILNY